MGKDITRPELEEILRRCTNIYEKFRKTGKLLHPKGFEDFVQESNEFKLTIEEGFPSLSMDSLIKDFQKNVFWPRNQILHFACTDFSRQEAIKSYNIAHLGLMILNSMDKFKRGIYFAI